jgi:hypothetical protein
MVVAECLAVASLSIGETTSGVPAAVFSLAFATAWREWLPARNYPVITPAERVRKWRGPCARRSCVSGRRAVARAPAKLRGRRAW